MLRNDILCLVSLISHLITQLKGNLMGHWATILKALISPSIVYRITGGVR